MTRQKFVFTLLLLALFLSACNIPLASPTPTLSIEEMVQTRIASMPTETPPPAPVFTPTLPPTATLPIPTPTLTLFYQPTATSTPSLAECPLIVTMTDTKDGDILHILRCEDNLEYDLGPFAKGAYAAGPNYKFIVYVTNNGYLYAAKVGDKQLTLIKNLVKERKFTAINKGALPKFSISFLGEAPYYRIVLFEKKFAQKYMYDVPAWMTE